MLRDWYKINKDGLSPRSIAMAHDAYDNCIAALDRGLGSLFYRAEAARRAREHAGHLDRRPRRAVWRTRPLRPRPEPACARDSCSASDRLSRWCAAWADRPRRGQPARHTGDHCRLARLRTGVTFSRNVARSDVAGRARRRWLDLAAALRTARIACRDRPAARIDRRQGPSQGLARRHKCLYSPSRG